MEDEANNLDRLFDRLDFLIRKQDRFSEEISQLQSEILDLKSKQKEESIKQDPIPISKTPEIALPFTPKNDSVWSIAQETSLETNLKQDNVENEDENDLPNFRSNLERFIGENLLSKIGIIILVIGVAIGAKYSIEHQLISPLTRIILGYLVGICLAAIGIKLKPDYKTYSAVLLSGAMAILYFITFAAFSFYSLFPREVAFGLMLVVTASTVYAALNYKKQIIAHIGLVGAYAVPFLLSDGSGKVEILFTYMTIINIGILIIAINKHWKPIYYNSFGLSWIIYLFWFVNDYQTDKDFTQALVFLGIFFATFYSIFLAYKLLNNYTFEKTDIIMLLANSSIAFGIGYSILENHESSSHLLGLFTLSIALIHGLVSFVIYRKKLADPQLFYLVSGLALVFVTITIPVQLDGNWVSLLWVGEAALLFWIGRTQKVYFYEILSYGAMMLAFISILQDWSITYEMNPIKGTIISMFPLFNINFLSSLFFILAFGFINWLHNNSAYRKYQFNNENLNKVIAWLIPGIFIFTIYYAFRLEISHYWGQLYKDSGMLTKTDHDGYINIYSDSAYFKFKAIWIINYSIIFFSLLSYLNIKKHKKPELGMINLIINGLVVLVFLMQGLYAMSELRENYQSLILPDYLQSGVIVFGLIYISFALYALFMGILYKYVKQDFIPCMRIKLDVVFDSLLYISIIWIASSELIAWMDLAHFTQSYKLGLSILWGVYALLIVALGIWKKKKYLRYGAMGLFGATLIKLFFYDISYLDTIAKTIVFVSLGLLLLLISFLYHKFNELISSEEDN